MHNRTLYILTRTPLHVGAGNSVGAVDAPVMRERHTGIPIIPGSSLKGVLADLWNEEAKRSDEGEFLFGRGSDESACAGSLLVGEARVLAFPVRSAAGCFAWITSPLALRRFARDTGAELPKLDAEPNDETCWTADDAKVCLTDGAARQVVLEDYLLTAEFAPMVPEVAKALLACMADNAIWQSLPKRLTVVSDTLFKHFVVNACEVVSRIRINDDTGTVDGGGLFNQEQVPSETMFYSVLVAQPRGGRTEDPFALLTKKLAGDGIKNVLQFGGDATIGLGFCDVEVK